ncbi:SAF domain-containing protein [Alicyclobacillus acidocaldarius]|uniref:SAF domain-containing protein n=1 Tax=Alicyclobacillus acidocaldarius subsp. acidocaldarius (strain ATCC 27009 / DSM 446 / BCRC 14685 / JCM 5260 / KCTC 1825 / NBRC 15652 / NCIMB 11725 / NRRL B-14509 / 104-IA) TaxID=521098 RepID=C8WVV4_ALIAD|nr:SAF domain-containing protein [Alicyclobacillus acidocaldarius]ACV58226.1 hypothetical protein Aaci_1195 [Alicyclobacillus acidocaldarius subsp. acidocaldarius DSM 446]
MKRSAFLLTGVGLAVIAGGLFAVGYKLTTDTVPVITAKTYIPADTPVNPSELGTEQVPRMFARQMGAITNEQSLAGRYLSVSAVPGEPLTMNMVATADDLQALVTQYAQAHHVHGVLVDYAANSALANAVQPGQDIALAINPSGQNATPELYPVHVLAVSAPQQQSNSPLNINNNSASKTLYLFVPTSEYDRIAQSILSGSARVVFLPNPSTGTASVPNATVAPSSPPKVTMPKMNQH